MTKTIHNSTPCGCCHRLMPRKAGKRKTCSQVCRKAATAETNRQRSLRRMDELAARWVHEPGRTRQRAQGRA
jgi:hypothetical protein